MLLTIEELRGFISTEETDDMLESRLQGIELMIRAYTNNNFQCRGYRCEGDIRDGVFYIGDDVIFSAGDTVEITDSELQQGMLVTVETVDETTFTVLETVDDDDDVLLTKVRYPMDVKIGAVNLLKWELSNREKVGISTETISRHSVTYFDMGGENSIAGYPRALMGFLKPYMRARFGRGVSV